MMIFGEFLFERETDAIMIIIIPQDYLGEGNKTHFLTTPL